MIRSIALLVVTVASSARVVSAQSADTATCRGSVARKAVVGRVVDAETGTPILDVSAHLEAHRPDTSFYSNSEVTHGMSITPVFHRRAHLDAAGRFCFTDLGPGEYRFETRAARYSASHQAIIVRLGTADTRKEITLRNRPYGRSPEDELAVANMLRALADHQRRWIRARPPHYLLRVKRDCFCLVAPLPTYEVLDGVAVAAIDSGGVRRALSNGEEGVTIDSLFDALRRKLLDERRYADAIEYDQRFGFPRHYKTGSVTPMTDAWEKVTVERFDVIK